MHRRAFLAAAFATLAAPKSFAGQGDKPLEKRLENGLKARGIVLSDPKEPNYNDKVDNRWYVAPFPDRSRSKVVLVTDCCGLSTMGHQQAALEVVLGEVASFGAPYAEYGTQNVVFSAYQAQKDFVGVSSLAEFLKCDKFFAYVERLQAEGKVFFGLEGARYVKEFLTVRQLLSEVTTLRRKIAAGQATHDDIERVSAGFAQLPSYLNGNLIPRFDPEVLKDKAGYLEFKERMEEGFMQLVRIKARMNVTKSIHEVERIYSESGNTRNMEINVGMMCDRNSLSQVREILGEKSMSHVIVGSRRVAYYADSANPLSVALCKNR